MDKSTKKGLQSHIRGTVLQTVPQIQNCAANPAIKLQTVARQSVNGVIIYLSIRSGRSEKVTFSTKIKLFRNQWDHDNEYVINHPDAQKLNNVLETKRIEIVKAANIIVRNNGELSFQALRDAIGKPQKSPQIQTFNQYYFHTWRHETEIGDNTLITHRQTLNNLNEFNPDIQFKNLNRNCVIEFQQFLKQKGYAINTIWGHCKNFKRYVNAAILDGLLPGEPCNHPFAKIKVQKCQDNRLPLTEKEVQTLKDVELPENLIKYRDMFLFLCYTGLRISDFMALEPQKYNEGILRVKPAKTNNHNTSVSLPLKCLFRGAPHEIWAQYNFQFPKISAQKINDHLKILAQYAGIKKHLTCHVARHTFLSQIAIKTGNVFTVMKLGGLRKTETAMIYIHLAEMDSNALVQGVNWD